MDLYTGILNFDKDSIKKIDRVTINYPVSWHECAEILEILGPLAMKLGPTGVVNWLKTQVKGKLN